MKLIEKHSLALRWLHWINFPLLGVMVWSGMMIYWAYQPYRVGLGDFTLFKFFPPGSLAQLGLGSRLAEGMSIHFLFMWLFALNGLGYLIYLTVSGQWRTLAPQPGSLGRAWAVVLHDLHLGPAVDSDGKYNDAQRLAYSAVILMGAGLVVTGLSIYKPVQLGWLTAALGGYEWARLEHFCLTIGVMGFFAIHVGQVIKAGWNNFRSMIAGFEVSHE